MALATRYLWRDASRISDSDPKSVTFNIMFSDPDKLDPDSDALFDFIIAETDNVIFLQRVCQSKTTSSVKSKQASFRSLGA